MVVFEPVFVLVLAAGVFGFSNKQVALLGIAHRNAALATRRSLPFATLPYPFFGFRQKVF